MCLRAVSHFTDWFIRKGMLFEKFLENLESHYKVFTSFSTGNEEALKCLLRQTRKQVDLEKEFIEAIQIKICKISEFSRPLGSIICKNVANYVQGLSASMGIVN